MKDETAADGVCLKRLFLSTLWMLKALPSLPNFFSYFLEIGRFMLWSQKQSFEENPTRDEKTKFSSCTKA